MLNKKEENPNYSIDELCQLFDEKIKSLRPQNKPLRRRHIPQSDTEFWELFERYQFARFLNDLIEEKRGKNTAYAFIFEMQLGKQFNEYCLKD